MCRRLFDLFARLLVHVAPPSECNVGPNRRRDCRTARRREHRRTPRGGHEQDRPFAERYPHHVGHRRGRGPPRAEDPPLQEQALQAEREFAWCAGEDPTEGVAHAREIDAADAVEEITAEYVADVSGWSEARRHWLLQRAAKLEDAVRKVV